MVDEEPPANSGATAVTATVNVAVVGTTIAVSGPNALVFGATLPWHRCRGRAEPTTM